MKIVMKIRHGSRRRHKKIYTSKAYRAWCTWLAVLYWGSNPAANYLSARIQLQMSMRGLIRRMLRPDEPESAYVQYEKAKIAAFRSESRPYNRKDIYKIDVNRKPYPEFSNETHTN